jgi:hypothetical protein
VDFLISALAVWRLSSLLVREDGPDDILIKLRSKIGVYYDEFSVAKGKSVFASAFLCVWCLSIWIAAIFALFNKPCNFADYIRRVLALSASAILIDKILD